MSFCPKRWLITTCLFVLIPLANLQIPLCPMMPAPIAVAQPVIPIVIRIADLNDPTSTTTTTITTTEGNVGQGQGILVPLAIPMPFHMPYPVPVPAVSVKPQNNTATKPPCPPCVCKPSCTPAFYSYCSPCHIKCRCKSNNKLIQSSGYAVPVPMVPAMPAPIIMVPYPPERPNSDECGASISSSCPKEYKHSYRRSNNKRSKTLRLLRRRRHRFTKRNLESLDTDDNDFARPVLTYISENGNIKIKKRLSDDEAADLLNDKESSQENSLYETVQVAADEFKKPRLVIKNGQYVLKQDSNQETLGTKKKN